MPCRFFSRIMVGNFVNHIIEDLVERWPGKVTIVNGRPRHPQSHTVKNEVCQAHQNVSIHTLFGKKCVDRDILVCMAHFSIYSARSCGKRKCESGGTHSLSIY